MPDAAAPVFAPPPARHAVHAALRAIDPAAAGLPWLALPGGRSNRLWRRGDLVIKLHDPVAASPLFPNDARAEARALAQFSPLGLAPQPCAGGADWLIYRHVAGSTWDPRAPGADPAAVARMLGRLHRAAPPKAGFRPLPNGSAAILAQAQGFAPADLPAPPPDPGIAPADPVCVHADAVAGNIIVTPQGPVLIDWQCPGLGCGAEDLAAFLSPAMHWLYTGSCLTADQSAAFLAGYPDAITRARYAALAPVLHWRIAAHCAWKARRGDADYAQALRLELHHLG